MFRTTWKRPGAELVSNNLEKALGHRNINTRPKGLHNTLETNLGRADFRLSILTIRDTLLSQISIQRATQLSYVLFWVRVRFGFWFLFLVTILWKRDEQLKKEQAKNTEKTAGRRPAFSFRGTQTQHEPGKRNQKQKESARQNFGTNFWHNFLDTSLHTLHTRDTTLISPATDESSTTAPNQHNHTHNGVIVKVPTPPEGFASHNFQVGHILATFFEACNAVRRPQASSRGSS